MTPESSASQDRLNRLLAYIEHDAGNLALRKDAVREACDIGQWGTARKLIDTGLESYPGEAGLLALSGFVYLQAQRYGDAEQALSAALARGFGNPEPRYNLAFAVFMQKRYPDALRILEAQPALALMPMALMLRARCLHHLGRLAEAIVACRNHLDVNAEDADAHGLLALLFYDQQQSEDAKKHAESALRLNPRQREALLAAASMQTDLQEYEAARATFATLLRAHPDCGRAWLGMGMIKLINQQTDAARHDLELAATYMPEHIGTWHVLAWTHIMRGNVLSAGVAFDRALVLDRNFGETHGGLAVIACLEGREADACGSIKRALRLDPQGLAAQYARMLLFQHHGQQKESQAVLEAVMARPVARSDMQYRDLVAAHMRFLRTATGPYPDPTVRH
jgi:tetratricopeptide (TPR) repeat protein